ncbi:MAG TPA: acyl-ACP--UDP-N-acetylglucosamine O-acyltransferase [Beijerinckiaceae bacterium]|nr:acyl-ACP--UDP-N-acetylglucosamine O-acyltransferase [Methylobacteriaceae bacterium]HRY03515.1 acyl-ACP--UDP-N-acetylglucosamine O-acyltransferase [Beijerinckiaceae bacterium]
MAADVHPSSVVAPGARIGAGVKIGPFCVVGEHVELAEGVELVSHVSLAGRTTIGARTRIYPFAALGHPPQDLKYRGEETTLAIGKDCIVREGVTANPGTSGGGMRTIIGDRCVLLAQAHVGHDSRIGNDVILSNNVMIAGHVRVGDFAILSGGVAVHQFARVGAHAFVGGVTGLEGDLVPFGLAFGNRAHLVGLNLVGLRRRNFSRETIANLQAAYRLIFEGEAPLAARIDELESSLAADPHVAHLVAFLREGGDRPLCRPRRSAGADE